jgi:hypothetical protein
MLIGCNKNVDVLRTRRDRPGTLKRENYKTSVIVNPFSN